MTGNGGDASWLGRISYVPQVHRMVPARSGKDLPVRGEGHRAYRVGIVAESGDPGRLGWVLDVPQGHLVVPVASACGKDTPVRRKHHRCNPVGEEDRANSGRAYALRLMTNSGRPHVLRLMINEEDSRQDGRQYDRYHSSGKDHSAFPRFLVQLAAIVASGRIGRFT